jgi:hypothetical protein
MFRFHQQAGIAQLGERQTEGRVFDPRSPHFKFFNLFLFPNCAPSPIPQIPFQSQVFLSPARRRCLHPCATPVATHISFQAWT